MLYAGTEATVFRIVDLIPDLGNPSELTLYQTVRVGPRYIFDSQHVLTRLPQHVAARTCIAALIETDRIHVSACSLCTAALCRALL